MIDTYVVNLKSSVERKTNMEAQLSAIPQLTVNYVEAIDARLMSDSEIAKVYDSKLTMQKLKRHMVKGEIGVALSQLKIMRLIADREGYGLIMEDDLLISPHFENSLSAATNFVNSKQPRIVLFTPIPYYSKIDAIPINANQNRQIYKVWSDASCAACYLINEAACKVVLSEFSKISNVIDNWGFFIQNGSIEIRAVVPHVISFSKSGLYSSTINLDDERDLKMANKTDKVIWMRRIIPKLIKTYQERKFKVVKNKNGVWYNKMGIIRSNF